MTEPAIIVARFAQYLGAVILLGAPLFFLYARAEAGSARLQAARRVLLLSAAALLALSALTAIVLQSALFTGSIAEGLKMENLGAVVTGMALGQAALVRAGVAGAAFVLLLLRPGPSGWIGTAALGLAATVALAWMGHGAAGEGVVGWIQLLADILHLLAAALWIGALVALLQLLVIRPRTAPAIEAVHKALERFSGIGSGIIAVLLLTGMVNGWVLIGPDRLASLWTSPYGRLLVLKVVLFGGMLGLAWINRFRLTPGLGTSLLSGRENGAALDALRRSLALETALGLIVLVLVAWLGTLAPPALG